jgi:arylsulfatase A-like enzyme
MKAIMVMFDSLNRRMLPPYGNDWVHAPNFKKLAEKTVTFDNCFVGSAPCMPARRELHTGRYNFLHRSWGPLEPFDDSMPQLLKQNGIYTHLVSDHYHYWEEGGCNYHTMYNSWACVRGQEGDPVYGEVDDPEIPENVTGRKEYRGWRQDWINRQYIQKEEDFPQSITFKEGIKFINKNYQADNWFLQIEAFDPHEPFFAPKKYLELYPHEYNGPHIDWPQYRKVKETPEEIQHIIYENAALISMCDENLGKVMAMMDRYDMWKDTMLIVNTDHGYLLGEHDWWGKNVPPFYNELANIPLFIWDPRTGMKDQRCECLVQTIDLPPTLLDFFGVAIPEDMQGKPLKDTILNEKIIREAALFGTHSGPVNCTDGRYVYMRAPVSVENKPLYNYTYMPTHHHRLFGIDELKTAELVGTFSFTKGCKVLKTEAGAWGPLKPELYETMLFDLKQSPGQDYCLKDPEVEKMMIRHMIRLMKENDAPSEQFERLGLSEDDIEGSIKK